MGICRTEMGISKTQMAICASRKPQGRSARLNMRVGPLFHAEYEYEIGLGASAPREQPQPVGGTPCPRRQTEADGGTTGGSPDAVFCVFFRVTVHLRCVFENLEARRERRQILKFIGCVWKFYGF